MTVFRIALLGSIAGAVAAYYGNPLPVWEAGGEANAGDWHLAEPPAHRLGPELAKAVSLSSIWGEKEGQPVAAEPQNAQQGNAPPTEDTPKVQPIWVLVGIEQHGPRRFAVFLGAGGESVRVAEGDAAPTGQIVAAITPDRVELEGNGAREGIVMLGPDFSERLARLAQVLPTSEVAPEIPPQGAAGVEQAGAKRGGGHKGGPGSRPNRGEGTERRGNQNRARK